MVINAIGATMLFTLGFFIGPYGWIVSATVAYFAIAIAVEFVVPKGWAILFRDPAVSLGKWIAVYFGAWAGAIAVFPEMFFK